MATDSRQNNRSAVNSPNVQKALANQKAAAKRRRKFILFGAELVLLAVMLGVLYIVFNTGGEGPMRVELPTEPDDLAIPSEVQQEIDDPESESPMKGYWNIALLGLDATNKSQLVKGSRSDSIIIASINLDTGDIKLVSVYRDTYLNTNPGKEGDTYMKCNAAYSYGGAERAVRMLNSNLALNITDYIAIGYNGLIGIIDGLGGVYLDVDKTELLHINNYQYSIIKDQGGNPDKEGAYIPVTSTGYQKLNGLQAAAYCRIRYRAGNDFARAASQREVLKAIEAQIKQADLATLTTVFETAMENVVTSLATSDIMPYLTRVSDFRVVEDDGFPQDDMMAGASMSNGKGSCVIPTSLESNVVWLHEFLFDDKNYSVPNTVLEYSQQIVTDTADRLK